MPSVLLTNTVALSMGMVVDGSLAMSGLCLKFAWFVSWKCKGKSVLGEGNVVQEQS